MSSLRARRRDALRRTMRMTLFHSTSATAAVGIERDGFLESRFGPVRGVFLSDRPLNVADSASSASEACFEVDVVTRRRMHKFEIIEEGRPPTAYREWIVPAAIVNGWAKRRYVEDDE